MIPSVRQVDASEGNASAGPAPRVARLLRCLSASGCTDRGNHEGGRCSQAWANSPDLFRLLVESVRDYAIFLLDADGHIRSWNAGAERIKGYKASEIIGKHFSIFYGQRDPPGASLTTSCVAIEVGRYEEEGWRIPERRYALLGERRHHGAARWRWSWSASRRSRAT